MKRTLFISVSAAALFVAGPAFAQSNESRITQGTGTGSGINSEVANKASVDQTKSLDGDVRINQQRFDNGVAVAQSGTNNRAVVNQTGNEAPPIGTPQSPAKDSGPFLVPVENTTLLSNFTNVKQDGADGYVQVTQFGNNNATVTQGATGANNQSYSSQDNDDGPVDEGTDNSLTVQQDGQNGFSSIDQAGTDNSAEVTQESTSDGAVSYVTQTGEGNIAKVTQREGGSDSFVTQTGDSNDAEVTQSGGTSFSTVDQLSDDNTADVAQNGGNNRSNIQQNAGATATVGSTADITQTGEDNYSFVSQTASGASVIVKQTQDRGIDGNGDDSNYSYVTQTAAASASVDQIGDVNFSSIDQRGVSYLATGPNALPSRVPGAELLQKGERNTSYITQIGRLNRAVVNQGNGGELNGSAEATDSFSSINQNGNNAVATVLQTGAGNESNINQFDEDQQAFVTQTGFDNQSFITQYGDRNIATVNQAGNLNFSEINQSGQNHRADVRQ